MKLKPVYKISGFLKSNNSLQFIFKYKFKAEVQKYFIDHMQDDTIVSILISTMKSFKLDADKRITLEGNIVLIFNQFINLF